MCIRDSVSSHLQRVRDLTEQAANGTYGSDSLKAIQSEITARLEEIDRIAANCEFNGLNMMDGSMKNNIALQVGLYGDASSQIELDASLFLSLIHIYPLAVSDFFLFDKDFHFTTNIFLIRF